MDDRRASLGCGTFILIALIVLLLGNTRSTQVLAEVQELQQTVDRVERQNSELQAQLTSVKALLKQVDERLKDG